MKKGFIASMVLVLGMVLLIGTSNAAIVSFKGMPDTVLPGESIKFEVWLDMLEEPLSDIAAFGLWIGVTPGGTWDTAYIKSTTLANPDYLFYGNSGWFDATLKGGGIYISDLFDIDPASTAVPVKLASLKLDQNFPYCPWLTFSVLDSGWSYALDYSGLVQDNFNPITGQVHVTPIPGTLLLLGSGLIGILGLVKRRLRK